VIVEVSFDVHGANASDIRDRAMTELTRFNDGLIDYKEWTICVEVHEEAAAGNGEIALWRGEVTARHHGPPF
jgi:hypothetical protein